MSFIKIVLFCVVSAIVYGIVHDQITARICIEYFTIGHPKVIESNDPTLLALAWGVLATWWGGVFLGFCIACAARLGSWPKRSMGSLVKPVFILLCVMAAGAIIAGIVGYIGAINGEFQMPEGWGASVPQEKHVGFITDLFAHNASYFFAFTGGIVLTIYILLWRRREARQLEAQS